MGVVCCSHCAAVVTVKMMACFGVPLCKFLNVWLDASYWFRITAWLSPA